MICILHDLKSPKLYYGIFFIMGNAGFLLSTVARSMPEIAELDLPHLKYWIP